MRNDGVKTDCIFLNSVAPRFLHFSFKNRFLNVQIIFYFYILIIGGQIGFPIPVYFLYDILLTLFKAVNNINTKNLRKLLIPFVIDDMILISIDT